MGRLGSYFPTSLKNEFFNHNYGPGTVLFLDCDFTKPPKAKFLVVLCGGSPPLLFIINSKIHRFICSQPDLYQCQVSIKAADHPFLTHDSFIDCSQVITGLDDDTIRQQVLNDLGRVKGELGADAKRAVIQAVASATTITPKHKELICGALQSSLQSP